MMNTIKVVITVSRRVGQVTFWPSARTSCRNLIGLVLGIDGLTGWPVKRQYTPAARNRSDGRERTSYGAIIAPGPHLARRVRSAVEIRSRPGTVKMAAGQYRAQASGKAPEIAPISRGRQSRARPRTLGWLEPRELNHPAPFLGLVDD